MEKCIQNWPTLRICVPKISNFAVDETYGGIRIQKSHLLRKLFWFQQIIRIQELDETAPSRRESRIACRRNPAVCLAHIMHT